MYLIRKISGFIHTELSEYVSSFIKYRPMIIRIIEKNKNDPEKAADVFISFFQMEVLCMLDKVFRKRVKLTK